MNKVIKVVAIAAVAGLALTACSTANTQSDEKALRYSGGPFSSSQYQECIEPGTRDVNWGSGVGDNYYVFPEGLRDFDFTGKEGAESAPFSSPSEDNVTMTISGITTFNLNTDCDVLREFQESVGNKFKPLMQDNQTTEKWKALLNKYQGPSIDKAADIASQKYTALQLYGDAEIREVWEDEVAALATKNINDLMGGEYFINFTFNLNTPKPPDAMIAALNAQQQAVAEGQAAVAKAQADGDASVAQAEAEQRTAIAQAETLRIQNESLAVAMRALGLSGPEGLRVYSSYLIAKDGNIPFLDLPDGAILNLPSLPTQ